MDGDTVDLSSQELHGMTEVDKIQKCINTVVEVVVNPANPRDACKGNQCYCPMWRQFGICPCLIVVLATSRDSPWDLKNALKDPFPPNKKKGGARGKNINKIEPLEPC